MAYEILQTTGIKITAVAGADLSTHQYKFVKLNSSGNVILCAAITDIPIGVLQNAPKSGEEAEVLVSGGTKIIASAAITLPALIGTTAAGLAATITAGTSTTVYTAGQALTAAGGANEVITAVVDFCAPGRAA